MTTDLRTITLSLSAMLSTVKSRYKIPGASFRIAHQSQAHLSGETDIAASGSFNVPDHSKFVMLGTEDEGLTIELTDVATSDVITLPLSQACLLPNASSTNTVRVLNASSTAATLRYILM